MFGLETKKEAEGFCRLLLSSSMYFKNPITAHHDFMMRLLRNHPDAKQKIGCGIKYFYVDYSERGSKCFWVYREDGSTTDFSFHTALAGQPIKEDLQVTLACRYVVKDQIRAAKERFFQEHGPIVLCEETGVEVSKETCHIDHVAPLTMQVLVKTFFATHNVKMSKRLLISGGDRNSHYGFKNPKWADLFRKYHKRVALLRVISAEANLRCKQNIPKVKRPLVL